MEKEEMRSFMEDFKTTLLKDMKDEIKTSVQSQIMPVVTKVNEIEQKVEIHDTKIYSLDGERRKRNIIIYRVQEAVGENFKTLEETVLNIFNNILQVPCRSEEIDFISRIGKNKNKNRPILVKMVTFRKKLDLLRSRGNLKDANINIDEDYTPEVREKRKQLVPQLKTLRAQGKKVELRQDRIISREEKGGERDGTGQSSQVQNTNNVIQEVRNKRPLSSPPDEFHSPHSKKFAAVPKSAMSARVLTQDPGNPVISHSTQRGGTQVEENIEHLSGSNTADDLLYESFDDTITK